LRFARLRMASILVFIALHNPEREQYELTPAGALRIVVWRKEMRYNERRESQKWQAGRMRDNWRTSVIRV
jgi:hypothetical protein